MLVVTMVLKLSSLVFDVELAFLNAKMDFDNYMATPKGVEADGDECVLLLKALYGSLQASRLWGLHYAKIMKKIGFRQSKSDPCLFVRQNEKGLAMRRYLARRGIELGASSSVPEFRSLVGAGFL